jgi:hypothetical protein
VGNLGHTVLFDGVTKYPPCPCPHGPACDAPCWGSGWRADGEPGVHSCPPLKPICRSSSDPFPCAGPTCTVDECCLMIMCMTGSWGSGEFTKGSGPETGGTHEHPPAADPLFYSINASRDDGSITIIAGKDRGWTVVGFSGPHVSAAYATNDYDDERVPGTFSESKQTWEPTDPKVTIAATLTIRVEKASEMSMHGGLGQSLATNLLGDASAVAIKGPAAGSSGCVNSHFSGFSIDRTDSWRLSADWCSGSCTEHAGPACTAPNGTYVAPNPSPDPDRDPDPDRGPDPGPDPDPDPDPDPNQAPTSTPRSATP